MANKRGPDMMTGASASSSVSQAQAIPQPPRKRFAGYRDTLKFSAKSEEELEKILLREQNKRLAERLRTLQKTHEELVDRNDALTTQHQQDERALFLTFRFWNQLDDDITSLASCIDVESANAQTEETLSPSVGSFLTQLEQWDNEELSSNLQKRLANSTRIVRRFVVAFERSRQAQQELSHRLDELAGESASSGDASAPSAKPEALLIELQADKARLDGELKIAQAEHYRLLSEARQAQLKSRQAEESFAQLKLEADDRAHQLTDLQFAHERDTERIEKLMSDTEQLLSQLSSAQEQLRTLQSQKSSSGEEGDSAESTIAVGKLKEMQQDLEDARDLAAARLQETEALQQRYESGRRQLEQLQAQLLNPPAEEIERNPMYRSLRTQVTLAFAECEQAKRELDTARREIDELKTQHSARIQKMESDEMACQLHLQQEMARLDKQCTQMKEEYEAHVAELEKQLQMHEHDTARLKELEIACSTMHNQQKPLKNDVLRYRKKANNYLNEICKLRGLPPPSQSQQPPSGSRPSGADGQTAHNLPQPQPGASSSRERESLVSRPSGDPLGLNSSESESSARTVSESVASEAIKLEAEGLKLGSPSATSPTTPSVPNSSQVFKSEPSGGGIGEAAATTVAKTLPAPVGPPPTLVSQTSASAQHGSLATTSGAPASSSSGQQQQQQHSSSTSALLALSPQDLVKKIKKLEDTLRSLHEKLKEHKQEEEALVNEMEVTAQAYEQVLDQNVRLVEQQKEASELHLRIITERLKWQQLCKQLKDDAAALQEENGLLRVQTQVQTEMIAKHEAQSRHLSAEKAGIENEMRLRTQGVEAYRRKMAEFQQQSIDARQQYEKLHQLSLESSRHSADKDIEFDRLSRKYSRLQEEASSLRRKAERAKKLEQTSVDEVLQAEINEYKCPSCQLHRKDAILSKCFHVFCYDCLKTRYDTRLRKCPKCNTPFGANDYHRIFIS